MPENANGGSSEAKEERAELQERISTWLDIPLSVLALAMLGLLVLELAVDLSREWAERVFLAQTAIWIIFAATFATELAIAPSKLEYLKKHWLTAISVALPALRVVRLLRIATAFRAVNLVRVITVLNRGTRALEFVVRRGQFGYVLALATVITVTSAAAAFYFERTEATASIRTMGDAIWWGVTTVTTINAQLEVVTFEGRVIGLLLRLVGLAISGYLTAFIAVYLIGGLGRPENTEQEKTDLQQVRREIKRLRALIEGKTEKDQKDQEEV